MSNIGLSILSVLFSAFLVQAGVSVLFDFQAPTLIRVLALMTSVYGVVNIGILAFAWWSEKRGLEAFSKYLAGGLLTAMILGSMDYASVSGHEWTAMVVAGTMLLINWFAVRQAVKGRSAAA